MKKFKRAMVGLKKQSKQRLFVVSAVAAGLAISVFGVANFVLQADTSTTASFEAELGAKSGVTTVADASAASGSAVRFGVVTAPVENSFTLASIPDTQVETSSASGAQRFNNRLQWLANNKTSLNLKYVWQVGDLQDWDDATHSHYVRASDGLKILEQAGVPYGLTVGNHDTAAVCTGGSACPGANTSLTFRNINTWHEFYPPSRFAGINTLCSEFSMFNARLMAAAPAGVATTNQNHPQFVKDRCAERNTTDNAYRTFTAGGLKWILINYEMWPRLPVQEWLETVLERHPDHNAILFTHMHLNGDGTIPGDFGGYGSPQGSPQAVQTNIITKFANVRFTFSGHTGVAACTSFTGANGNKIYSYLDNRREGSSPPNHVRLMKIDVAARTATSQLYVPQNGQTLSQGSNCNVTGITWVR
ncbi:MAG: hypothetical protein WBP26_05390 [Candidatus Saccharimonadales bacterium]